MSRDGRGFWGHPREHHENALRSRRLHRSVGHRTRVGGIQTNIDAKLREAYDLVADEIRYYDKAIEDENDIHIRLDMVEYQEGLKEARKDLAHLHHQSKDPAKLKARVREEYQKAQKHGASGNSMKQKGRIWVWTETYERVI